jgi:hypothetical protein
VSTAVSTTSWSSNICCGQVTDGTDRGARRFSPGRQTEKKMKHLTSVMAILLMSGGLAFAQAGGGAAGAAGGGGVGAGAGGNAGAGTGPTFTPTNPSGTLNPSGGGTVGQAPGGNPNNPQDQINRNNPQDLSKPGAANPQDLKR